METLVCIFVAAQFTCEAVDRPRGDFEPIVIERHQNMPTLTNQTWVYCTDARTCPIVRVEPRTAQLPAKTTSEWQLSEADMIPAPWAPLPIIHSYKKNSTASGRF